MRGEQLARSSFRTRSSGSPPHARGTVVLLYVGGALNRITPACAGNSQGRFVCDCRDGDHPRMRGEQLAPCRIRSPKPGSPPHARGTAIEEYRRYEDRGITPACAGNSLQFLFFGGLARDHPRMRGEQLILMPTSFLEWGSPPHARGTE